MAENRRTTLFLLLLVGLTSLILINALDDYCYWFLARTAPSLKLIPAIRLTSLTFCAILCFIFSENAFRLPQASAPWRIILISFGSWLSGSILALFVFHVWTPSLPTWIDVTSFLVTGLLAEELLFRGAVFSLAEKAFHRHGHLPFAAIAISALLFSVQHLGYHGWHLTAQALTQMSYTLAFGVLLGLLRAWTGSLWIPILLHLANNLVTVAYRHFGN